MTRPLGGLGIGLSGGLVGIHFFFSVELVIGLIIAGLNIGLAVGLLEMLGIVSMNEIHLVEAIRWEWKQFWKKMLKGLKRALLVWLVCFVLVIIVQGGTVGSETVLLGWLLMVLSVGLLGGMLAGLSSGFVNLVKLDKVFPNQGIKLSLKNGLAALLIGGTIGGMFGGLFGVIELLASGSMNRFLVPFFAVLFGLPVGFSRGGSAVVKHYSLRLILWLTGSTPLRFIPFLDHCAKLILLKKVGGGYMFIHRTLLEYFAGLSPEAKKAKEISRGSAS